MKKGFNKDITIFSKISHIDRLLFTKHLSVMIKAGIPIAEAVESLSGQSKTPAFKKVLLAMLADINNGQSISKAMAKHPKAFSGFYLSLIEIGEESGTLEKNLEFLSVQLAKDNSLRKKVQGALLYPGIVLAATAIIGLAISLFILPQLVGFFDAFNSELPLATKILLFLANATANYGWLILIGIAALVSAFLALIKTPKIKPIWHKALLSFPLIGPILRSINLARFSRNLGTLLSSGVPISRSLQVTANTLDNLLFSSSLLSSGKHLQKGQSLAKSLEKVPDHLFPSIVTKMVAVGEKTGKLEETLLYLGEFYEDEVDQFSKNLSTILEPILLVVIGLVVGFVAMAIISPIYELTGTLR
jgi:type IV pilus assembly protein PilC